ncbi:MAG: ABC transporter permease, partial [Chloroflexi bacterium]|nr:ABC transporter permease [Chloroflexota bacterium]
MAFSLRLLESRRFITLVLLGALAWSAYNIDWSEPIVHSGGGSSLVTLVKSVFTPELSPSFLKLALEATWVTIAYAVAGISLAVPIGL